MAPYDSSRAHALVHEYFRSILGPVRGRKVTKVAKKTANGNQKYQAPSFYFNKKKGDFVPGPRPVILWAKNKRTAQSLAAAGAKAQGERYGLPASRVKKFMAFMRKAVAAAS
jgi:hypothetical protein